MPAELDLSSNIKTIKGIGDSSAKKLEKLGIQDVRGLLAHFPRSYIDYSHPVLISQLTAKKPSSFTATINSPKTFYSKSGKLITQAVAKDQSGKITLTWFNNPYIKKLIEEGYTYTIAGTPSIFGNLLTIISPSLEEGTNAGLNTSGLVPVYPLTKGITSRWLRSKIHNLLDDLNLPEFVPSPSELPSINFSLKNIHFPTSNSHKKEADKKLSYLTHFKINLDNELEKQKLGYSLALKIDNKIHEKTVSHLPFTLTADQIKVVNSLYKDLKTTDHTHRLIQGDTGSGKTATLFFAFSQCLSNNYSAVLLVPTEILAIQHFQSFKKYFIFPDQIQLVTRNSPISNTDQPTLYIGTHSLLNQLPINPEIPVAILAIDEQHKFGVEQRKRLTDRSPVPHLINLSATPIPRTVALGLLGDIDISNIKTLPQNRVDTKTYIVTKKKLLTGKKWFRDQLVSGNQIFVVCPRIDSETSEVDTTEKITQFYQKYFDNEFKILTLHGKQSSTLQQKTIDEFKEGVSQIMVSTSIIEVGIDIPKANIIIIHSAEQFGLAQLHQLRGRVGRGGYQGHCFLISGTDEEVEIERLSTLKKYNSGLILAKKDLVLRGAGEVFGSKQHGQIHTRLAYFWSKKLFQQAKQEVKKIIKHDPEKANLIATKPVF